MKKDKSQNKLQIFFMLIVIPAVFAVILAVVLSNFMNIDIGGSVKSAFSALPFLEAEVEDMEDSMDVEETLARLEHENENNLTVIEQLEHELEQKDEELRNLEEELAQMKRVNEAPAQDSDQADSPDYANELRGVIRTLETMTASKAANIIDEMSDEEAVMYLRNMNVDARSQILSRVEPAKAAEIISLLAN